MSYNNWREDGGLTSTTVYRRRFAFLPTRCSDNTMLWFKSYYTKYVTWTCKLLNIGSGYSYSHTDIPENITESEYIIRKLAGNIP